MRRGKYRSNKLTKREKIVLQKAEERIRAIMEKKTDRVWNKLHDAASALFAINGRMFE